MSHLDEGTLHALLDGELDVTEAREVQSHLGTCVACGSLLQEVKQFLAEADRLVGIVSRADLLKSFLRDDASIHREVVEDVLSGDLAIEPEAVVVVVKDGTVVLPGEVDSRTLRDMMTRMVGAVPGVVSVFNRVTYRLDDQHLKTTREPADNLTYSGPPLR